MGPDIHIASLAQAVIVIVWTYALPSQEYLRHEREEARTTGGMEGDGPTFGFVECLFQLWCTLPRQHGFIDDTGSLQEQEVTGNETLRWRRGGKGRILRGKAA